MGPATVEAASRGAHVVAVDPSRFMRAVLGFRRQFQKNPGLITVEAGVAEKFLYQKAQLMLFMQLTQCITGLT